jgi:hypothetical protein
MIRTVRVYADGRLCIPAGVLTAFRKSSKKSRQAVWVSLFNNGTGNPHILLTWNECTGSAVRSSKKYDLSVRDRVLFQAPKDLDSFRHGQEYGYQINALGVHIDLGPQTSSKIAQGPTDQPKAVSSKAPKARKRSSRRQASTSLEQKFNAAFRVNLCWVLALPEYRSLTLGELAQAFPDLTVGEIVSA